MAARRHRGDGGVHWDESRQRWIGTVTVGYDTRGKRRTRRVSTKTRTEADRNVTSRGNVDHRLTPLGRGFDVRTPVTS